MPTRLISQNICKSKSINNLTPFEECLFYRLIVSCDDYGRYDANTKLLKGFLFPLKEVTFAQIEKSLQSLAREGMVQVYECNGESYLQLSNWDKFQNVRSKKSKYPEPENICIHPYTDANKCMQMYTDANGCKRMQTNAYKCSRNPILILIRIRIHIRMRERDARARDLLPTGLRNGFGLCQGAGLFR